MSLTSVVIGAQNPTLEAPSELLEALDAYPLPTTLQVAPITEGLIHQTYALQCEGGARFIMQRLHPLLNTDETLEDYEVVTAHLSVQNYGGPELVCTREGTRASRDSAGGRWRLSTFVPGVTRPHIESPEQAALAAQGLASFHRVMSSLTYEFKSPHPGHDTQGHWRRLREASERPEHAESWAEIKGVASGVLRELEQAFLPTELPKVVVHGDPKVTNLRFQEERAVLIDLDTCARHTRLVDLGDALRSWCDLSREGAVSERGSPLSLERCQAAIEAYLEHSDPLTELERAWLPRCARTITLELASRFARDYLEDHYFAFDATRFKSRRAHNAHRVASMWRLAEELKEAEPLMARWVRG